MRSIPGRVWPVSHAFECCRLLCRQCHDAGAYNGNRLAGDPVIWDPCKQADGTDVKPGQSLRIKVCLVDGASASTGLSGRELTPVSVDG